MLASRSIGPLVSAAFVLAACALAPRASASSLSSQATKPPAAPRGPSSRGAVREPAILDGLRWLARHQNPDGSWSPADVAKRCASKPSPCVDPEQTFTHDYDTGVTGLSLLAFLGAGHDTSSTLVLDDAPGRGRLVTGEVVRAGLDWLARQQRPDGAHDSRPYLYNEAAATAALCDAYRMTRAPERRRPAQRALAHLVAMQKASPVDLQQRWGWHYDPRALVEREFERNPSSQSKTLVFAADLSCTGFAAMALEAARASGLEVDPRSLDGAHVFACWVSANDGRAGYDDPKHAGLHQLGRNDHFQAHPGTMSATAAYVRLVTKPETSDPFLPLAAKVLVADLPLVSKDFLSVDYDYWYWGELALRRMSARDANSAAARGLAPWGKSLDDALEALRSVAPDCSKGGFVTPDRWAYTGGAVYTTSMAVMTLSCAARAASLSARPIDAAAAGPRLDGRDPTSFEASRTLLAKALRARGAEAELAVADAIEVHALARASSATDVARAWKGVIDDLDGFSGSDVLVFVEEKLSQHDSKHAAAVGARVAQLGATPCSRWLAERLAAIEAARAMANLAPDETVRTTAQATHANALELARRGLHGGVRAQIGAANEAWSGLVEDVARARLRASAAEAEVDTKALSLGRGRLARASNEVQKALDGLSRAKDDADWWKRVRAVHAAFAALDVHGAELAQLGGARWSAPAPAVPAEFPESFEALVASARELGGMRHVERARVAPFVAAHPHVEAVLVADELVALFDARQPDASGLLLRVAHFGAPSWRIEPRPVGTR